MGCIILLLLTSDTLSYRWKINEFWCSFRIPDSYKHSLCIFKNLSSFLCLKDATKDTGPRYCITMDRPNPISGLSVVLHTIYSLALIHVTSASFNLCTFTEVWYKPLLNCSFVKDGKKKRGKHRNLYLLNNSIPSMSTEL